MSTDDEISSLRSKIAETQLHLQRLMDFEIEYEAQTKTSSPSALLRIARLNAQKKQLLSELDNLERERRRSQKKIYKGT
jgi:hypothetical protein